MEGIIKLSLLIVSLRERRELLNRLLSVLYPQLTDQVELLICTTGKGETTGSKRNRLLASACGKYTCFIDDDDLVAVGLDGGKQGGIPGAVVDVIGVVAGEPFDGSCGLGVQGERGREQSEG